MADMSNPKFNSVTVFRKPTLTLQHVISQTGSDTPIFIH